MRRFDLPKFVFYTVAILGVLVIVFSLGTHAGSKETLSYRLIRSAYDNVKLVKDSLKTLFGIEPTNFLQDARYPGQGVTVNGPGTDQDELVLVSGFFENDNGIRLMRRDGTILASWRVKVTDYFAGAPHLVNPPVTDWDTDLHGAIAGPDGSIAFNFEKIGLVKLDRCGKLLWKLNRVTHHSIEPAVGGGYWVGGSRYHHEGAESPFPPYKTPYMTDTLLHVSDDGKTVEEISIGRVLFDSGLYSLVSLTGAPRVDRLWETHYIRALLAKELFHANDVEELTPELAEHYPMFKAGDLMVSFNARNLVIVVDRETKRVKWWKLGPWVRQHDPDFRSDGKISVFNNNPDESLGGVLFGGSTIIEVDPATDVTRTVYGGKDGQRMYSRIRGKHQVLPGGRILITEHEGGRALEIDPSGRIVWEFVNRYGPDKVAEITEARAYPKSYFKVSDWSCTERGARQ